MRKLVLIYFAFVCFAEAFSLESQCIDAFAQKEAKRFKLKVGVFLVLIQDEQVLLLKRYNTGIADGLYVVPMGGLDEGETVTQALIREAREETNIVLRLQDLNVRHVMHRLHHLPDGRSFEQIDVYFVPNSYEGVVKNMEPNKCDELKFYPLGALPENLEPFIYQAIQHIREGQFFSEFGWNPKGWPTQS